MTGPFVLPETAVVLEQLAAQEGPHLADLSAEDARGVYHLLGTLFEDDVDPSVRWVDLEGPGCVLRAYFPGTATPGPVILFMHGGGWMIGDLNTHHSLCTRIAKLTGLRVVAVDYRCAPEHPFPAAHEDCLAAAEFVAAGPPGLEAPVTGLAVAGDSAGGNLAYFLAMKLGADRVLAQLLIYPLGDSTSPTAGSYVDFAEGFLLDRKLMDRFITAYLPDPADRDHAYVSPLLQPPSADLPPAVVLTAGLDPLRDQGRELACRLAAQGIEVHFLEAAGLIHGMATMRKALPTGDRHIARAVERFAEFIQTTTAKNEGAEA